MSLPISPPSSIQSINEPIPDLSLPKLDQLDLKNGRQTSPASSIATSPSVASTASSTTPPEISFSLPSLTPAHAATYLRFAQTRYPNAVIREMGEQGRCSLTFVVHDGAVIREDDGADGGESGSDRGGAFILQFRPPRHKIDLDITQATKAIWGELVPVTRYVGVVTGGGREKEVAGIMETGAGAEEEEEDHKIGTGHEPGMSITVLPSNAQKSDQTTSNSTILVAYTHTLLPGIPLSSLQTPTTTYDNTLLKLNLHPLLRALAKSYFAPAFRASLPPSSPHLPVVKRSVAWTVRRQLRRLERGLPGRFRGVVRGFLEGGLEEIEERLPWVLTHGDFIGGGNVLVDGEGTDGGREVRLTGLVDWAEGEWLPFGVGLYGVEEVLGQVVEVEVEVEDGDNDINASTSKTRANHKAKTKTTKKFEYLPNADALRVTFWAELTAEIPELADPVFRRRMEKARVLGLLLWYGIAFDDGALNRVAREGEDDGELQKLELFLFGSGSGYGESLKRV